LLEVVEHQQELAWSKKAGELLDQRPGADFIQTESLSDRRRHKFGIANGGEFDEANTVVIFIGELGGDLQRKTSLADASWSRQRDKRDVILPQELAEGIDVMIASDERCARQWERREENVVSVDEVRRPCDT
jgi:hypothetical protein